MKILHTSDWHLGKKLEHKSRQAEQERVMAEIVQIADDNEVNAVIISGDLFDSFTPPVEALDLFYKTLKQLSKNGARAVVAIAGNHDSPERIEAPDPLARECGIVLLGYPQSKIKPFTLDTGLSITNSEEGFLEIRVPNINVPLRLLITPYANEFRLKKFLGHEDPDKALINLLNEKWHELANRYCDTDGINILAAHLYMLKKGSSMFAEPDEEKSILHIGGANAIFTDIIPPQVQYVALGHLHKNITITKTPCPVVYPGSPLTYSFNDNSQNKSVTILEAQPKEEIVINKIPLLHGNKLLRNRFTSIDEALDWLQSNQEAWIELTLVTDTYISAEEQKQLYDAHKGIIHIIPEIVDAKDKKQISQHIDLTKDIKSLFEDYFHFKRSDKPDKLILDVFDEIMGTNK
jgi:DNA repair protein SbcD/Mre11